MHRRGAEGKAGKGKREAESRIVWMGCVEGGKQGKVGERRREEYVRANDHDASDGVQLGEDLRTQEEHG